MCFLFVYAVTVKAFSCFRDFFFLPFIDAELPRATQTSALSSAGVLRLFNRVGETVNKMTFKMDESDQVIITISGLESDIDQCHGSIVVALGKEGEFVGSSESRKLVDMCKVFPSMESSVTMITSVGSRYKFYTDSCWEN